MYRVCGKRTFPAAIISPPGYDISPGGKFALQLTLQINKKNCATFNVLKNIKVYNNVVATSNGDKQLFTQLFAGTTCTNNLHYLRKIELLKRHIYTRFNK